MIHARSVHQECTGQKTLRSRAFPPHTLPRSPTIFLTAPLSYEAVAIHLGQCEKLRRYRKLATSSIYSIPAPAFKFLTSCKMSVEMRPWSIRIFFGGCKSANANRRRLTDFMCKAYRDRPRSRRTNPLGCRPSTEPSRLSLGENLRDVDDGVPLVEVHRR